MKKMTAVMFIIVTVLTFVACGGSKSASIADEKTTVTTVGTETTKVESSETVGEISTEKVDVEQTETESENASEPVETNDSESTEQQNSDESEVPTLMAYFGERIVNVEDIPTYSTYLESQENAYASDFGKNDPRRLFFKTEITQVVAEYEDNGKYYENDIDIFKLDEGLYRINPTYEMYDGTEGKRTYVTFKITDSEERTYFMTWIPPIE